MTYDVITTEQAAREIEISSVWWARERSVEQAEKWYVGIRAAIKTLETNPERCPSAAESPDFPYILRELYFGLGARPTHRAIFTIVKQTVVVISVRHAAQDRLRPDDA